MHITLPQEGFDDAGQEATIAVWEALHNFKGPDAAFYRFVKSICRNKGINGHKKGLKDAKAYVSLQIDDDDGFSQDNPELYRQESPVAARRLPETLSEKEVWVCNLIREGLDYVEIGKYMGSAYLQSSES